MCLFKFIIGLLSKKLFIVNVLTSPQNSWNMQKRTFILFILHSERNCFRKSLFSIRSEILGLLENTLIGNYEYSRSNRGDLLLPIQIKLSKKPETFCDLFLHLWYLHQISNVLKKKMILVYIWSYWLRKMCFFKCITRLLCENCFAVNVLTSPKNCWYLQKGTLILLFLSFWAKLS